MNRQIAFLIIYYILVMLIGIFNYRYLLKTDPLQSKNKRLFQGIFSWVLITFSGSLLFHDNIPIFVNYFGAPIFAIFWWLLEYDCSCIYYFNSAGLDKEMAIFKLHKHFDNIGLSVENCTIKKTKRSRIREYEIEFQNLNKCELKNLLYMLRKEIKSDPYLTKTKWWKNCCEIIAQFIIPTLFYLFLLSRIV